MKKIGITGTLGKVPRVSFMATPKALNFVGGNTGNLFFQYAVANDVLNPKAVIGIDLPWDPAVAREQLSMIVVPAANFVQENFDLSGFVEYLEATDLPLVVVGLGVQADSFEKVDFNLHPSIHRLLSLLAERCTTVGVRGAYTAAILDDLGLRNTQVIGCPSNFINRDPDFCSKLKRKWDRPSGLIAATGDEPWPLDQRKQLVERKIIEILKGHGGVYVLQSVEPVINLIRSASAYHEDEVSEHDLRELRDSLCPGSEIDEFRRFLSTYSRLYFDVDQWLEDMGRFDLSLGLRLHGNMVAFQAGCPAIWIHHDSRTRELCSAMDLPSISIEKFLECGGIEQIKSEADVDFDRYLNTRNALRTRYCSILSDAGLTVQG